MVLVPSTGFSYLNHIDGHKKTNMEMFSSPPRGSLISICEINGCMGHMGRILVPSTGFSYLNVLASVVGAGIGLFSSPPRGSLISIR